MAGRRADKWNGTNKTEVEARASGCPSGSRLLPRCEVHVSKLVLNAVCVLSAAGSPYCLAASHQTWSSLQRCWSAELFLPALAHRLWRLTLQVLARYSVFVREVRARPGSTAAKAR